MRKKVRIGILAGVLTLGMGFTAFAGQWQLDNVGWWYDNGDGTWPANQWQWLDGNGDGVAECYYFNQNGYCLLNTTTPDGYTVDGNGAWTTDGIVQIQIVKQNAPTAGVASGSLQAQREAYQPVLDLYYTALSESWPVSELQDQGMNYMLRYYSEPSELGYSLIDIDNNGVLELFTGELRASGEYKGMFIDMYTLLNNRPVHVVSSGERDRYYLCTDWRIVNEGSGGALNSSFSGYRFDGEKGVLSLIETVIYDGWEDENNPWFYSVTENRYDKTPISEKKAMQIKSSYHYREFDFTPLPD